MKAEVAIIAGSGASGRKIFKKEKNLKIKTRFGFSSGQIKIIDFSGKRAIFLIRHGQGLKFPPHKINYRANILALRKLGARHIFAFNSVGSLKPEIKPGNLVIISDYIDFEPPTFFDKEPEFVTPQMSEELRKVLANILRKTRVRFWPKGVYFNSKGPRLETKAEINLIKNFADVVGMTMAKEATLAQELNLGYACLCSVDNYAHGIGKKSLSQEQIIKNQKKNNKILEKIMLEILKLKI
jgi:5'-methylthioadenosine phosphorylase